MNIRDLRYFVILGQTLHFAKAAELCFVTQPTLSYQIKKLEETLEVVLFERTNKSVQLTDAGKRLLFKANDILQQVDDFTAMAKQWQDPFECDVKLGIIPSLAPYLLPIILPEMKKALPKVNLIVHEDKTDEIIKKLEKGFLDAIILALPVAAKQMIVSHLFDEPFWVAIPKGHALTNKKTVTVKDLEKENLLLLSEGHCLRDQALEICHRPAEQLPSGFEAASLETIRHLVSAGEGITLLPELALGEDDATIDVVAFKQPKPHRSIGMLYRKTTPKVVCLDKIIDVIRLDKKLKCYCDA